LIQSGASLDDMGFDGMNPIAAAICRRHVDVVSLLIGKPNTNTEIK